MAEESINTDKTPRKDNDELTVDELDTVAGGQEQQRKVTKEEAAKTIN